MKNNNEHNEYDRLYADLDLDDKSDGSFYSTLPQCLRLTFDVIPKSTWAMPEEKLREMAKITPAEELVRISFWQEYDRARRRGDTINVANVYHGYLSKANFMQDFAKNAFKVAYMLTPLAEVQTLLEEIVYLGLKAQKEILMLPNLDEKNRPNAKLLLVKERITQAALDRRRGHVLRQIDINSTSKNLNIEMKSGGANTLEEIERKLAELEAPKPSFRDVIDVSQKEKEEVSI